MFVGDVQCITDNFYKNFEAENLHCAMSQNDIIVFAS